MAEQRSRTVWPMRSVHTQLYVRISFESSKMSLTGILLPLNCQGLKIKFCLKTRRSILSQCNIEEPDLVSRQPPIFQLRENRVLNCVGNWHSRPWSPSNKKKLPQPILLQTICYRTRTIDWTDHWCSLRTSGRSWQVERACQPKILLSSFDSRYHEWILFLNES